MTSEAHVSIADKLRPVRNMVWEKIKQSVEDKHFGSGVIFWGHILISSPPEFYKNGFFSEIKKYSKKKKEVELRLRVDYESMIRANDKEIFTLIADSILRAIDIAESELEVEEFDFGAFRKDIISLFKKECWI